VSVDGSRRTEILETASQLLASSGLRTSLNTIAEACGILPGSLYHHFESKEAILVELVERYRADLDTIAANAPVTGSVTEDVVALGSWIAACAIRHRAALLITLYDPPTGESKAVEAAMLDVLKAGRARNEIRKDVDLETLADRLCQVLLHISLGVFGDVRGAEEIPAIRCRTLLQGVAVKPPSDRVLDRSPAFDAAQATIAEWEKPDDEEDQRLPMLRGVARAEFGRRGYETTTVRDIAKAAGMSVGSVYRLIGSKEELLDSIMRAFTVIARTGWSNVLRADATVVEKLDALMWVNINAVDRFADEYNIQLAWIRESPPDTANLGSSFAARLADVKRLLATGTKAGELHVDGASADVRAWALFELLWMPANIIEKLGPRGALKLARETTLRGARR
jgi:AcrR family transcriptional regulator